MGIKITAKTKAPNALKLSNKIRTYLFEEEYGELKGKQGATDALKQALIELSKLVNQ